MYKALKIFIFLILLGAAGYFWHAPLLNLWTRFNIAYFPCAQPIGYTINSFDARFGISKDQFTQALNKAEQIWEKPLDKELFAGEPDGNLKINLIYDYRQEATIKLRKLGLVINDDRASYDALKLKLKALETDYAQKKIFFQSQLAIFQDHKKSYETKVAYWNERGGAVPKAYAQLNEERAALDAELAQINKLQNDLNAAADNINAMITVLNRLARSLNIDAEEFNQTNEARGEEFEEGLYQSGPDGQEIDIYQFDSADKLTRVLAHELGHALGLEHLDDPKAIMYRLNQGTNAKLSADDLAALKTLCRVK
ncbi:MAG: matrixin family metalloprotease [Patescibacteria group bacterium]